MHTRNAQTRLVNSRPKGSSYLDLIRKMGHLNLLDLPHYLQVNNCNKFLKVGQLKFMISLNLKLQKIRNEQYGTVKPRFTAEFGGKETPAVNWGPR